MNAFFELMKNKSLFYPFSNQILEDIKTNVNNKQDMNKMEDLIDSIGPVAYQGFPSYPLEEEKEDEEEVYKSDNEEEDKWDNLKKACWEGYTQRGMKEKNGRMVPNCVPVKKMYKSIWGGTFLK